ncbi:MAG TPA: hypothetical protein VFB50_20050 [Chloroflexota bacterium]|nr:hypothetical protein [Chloroflexota bacterium]
MQHPFPARRQAQPSGVIEALSAGYATVNRHLWVLVLPILVDLVLWFGPHVSYSPLVDPTVTRASEMVSQVSTGPRRAPRDLEFASSVDTARQWLIARTGEVNALTLVAHGPIAIPSLDLSNGQGDFAFVSDWGAGLGLLAAIVLSGLFVGGCFYSGLAEASSGRPANPLRLGRCAPRYIARVLGLLCALIGVGLLLGLPVLLLVAFTWFVARAVATFALLLVGVALLVIALYLFFALDAIFVSDVGPLSAIQRSVGVVRRHLLASIALVLLTWLILAGMDRVWDLLAGNLQPPFGIALSILGNAYIASGLIAASMIFYTERTESPPSAATASAVSPS